MYGGLQETKVSFNPNIDYGFFLFDIDSGVTKKLYPIEYFESFIDNEKILVRTTAFTTDRFIVFNINTFEADYGFVKEKFGFGAGQFDFTSDGSKWTYILSPNPTTDNNIIYATFPNKEGEVIESAGWGDFSSPIFSPEGTKIAYAKGSPGSHAVWVYDTNSKKKTKYSEGAPMVWIDENTILITQRDFADLLKLHYFLLDLTNNTTTEAY